jgi:hypothetical protein
MAPGLTFSPTAAVTDAFGTASTIVTASTGMEGPMVVFATAGGEQVAFTLFVRRLSVESLPNSLVFRYTHEHIGVPLIFGVDAAGVPPISTPWGTMTTSILSPGSSFAYLDGLGILGPIDPGMQTDNLGRWSLSVVPPPPLGLSFVAQIYGYDAFAVFPYDYIVSNSVVFNL